ncbi:MAG TPA: ATP-binding protein [Anaerolineae bacterium]|nr:ATP-binding protein [Anaerolineae bacterium]
MNNEVLRFLDSAQQRLKTLLQTTTLLPSSSNAQLTTAIQETLAELRAARKQLHATKRVSSEPNLQFTVGQRLELLDTLSDGYIVTSADGSIIEINRSGAHLLRRARAFLLGKSLAEFLVDKDKPLLHSALLKLEQANLSQEFQVTLRRAHEAPFPAWLHVSRLASAPGCLHWLLRDLSEIQRTEKARQRLEFLSYASQLLSAAPDLNTRVERVTRLAVPSFADLCIIHVRDAQGQTLKIQVAHSDPTKEQEIANMEAQRVHDAPHPASNDGAADKRKFATRVTDELLNDIAYADEHLVILRALNLKSYISVPLKTHGRSFGAVVFATAESGRVYEQEDLLLAEAFARRAALAIENALRYEEAQATLAERDRALALALKEIKIPLNVILNLTQVLKTHLQYTPAIGASFAVTGSETDELLQTHLEDITRASERLLGMVNDMTELTQIQNQTLKLHPTWVNLSELVNSVAESMRLHQEDGRYPRDLKIRVHIPDTPQISVLADEERLAQVLTNLFDNALKYSPRGGTVDVQLAVHADEETPDAPYAHFIIRDHGIGVPPDEHERIFQPFVRATNTLGRNISGMGIGLALCQEIITRHNGRIWVESDGVNLGSAFHIVLPQIELETI